MIQETSKTTTTKYGSFSDFPSAVIGERIGTRVNSADPFTKKTNETVNKILSDVFKTKVSDNIEFDAIKKRFNLINEVELQQFLTTNSFLYSLLIKGMEIIKKEAGADASASLELYTFIEGGNKSIFISVHTNQDIDDDIEENILSKILSLSLRSMEGKLVISVVNA